MGRNRDFSTSNLAAVPKVKQIADAARRSIHAHPRWRGIVVHDVKQFTGPKRCKASLDVPGIAADPSYADRPCYARVLKHSFQQPRIAPLLKKAARIINHAFPEGNL